MFRLSFLCTLLFLSGISGVFSVYFLVANLSPTNGSRFTGSAYLEVGPNGFGADIYIDLDGGLSAANKTFSVAINTWGDLSAMDGSATGLRYFLPAVNTSVGTVPEETPGCYPSSRDVGNLGNVTANSLGVISAVFYSDRVAVVPNARGYVIGRSIVLNSAPDLCSNDTSSRISNRILAQGVIGYGSGSDVIIPNKDMFPANISHQLTCTISKIPAAITPARLAGNVYFQQLASGITAVIVRLTGVVANHNYSLHIHQYGDISDAFAYSVGDHLNPYNQTHGCPNSTQSHLGDLGTITSNANGVINSTILMPRLSLSPTTINTIIGRSVVLKSGADNCQDNPNDLNRIGYCVIGRSNWQKLLPDAPVVSAALPLSFSFSLIISLLASFLFLSSF
eukprot:TRINITY_DN3457_c0_g1_i1.p1 TRINITY_DN3457_c0_g1~~TRINITY_DN3457_c0_g1_i1.p1  ORF type:complete len:440 (-),score=135.54 TRINITY_DN3457_c0_g1_i1:47-1228(-)